MKPRRVARPAWRWIAKAFFMWQLSSEFRLSMLDGGVVAILNRPEQADPSLGPVTSVTFGGADRQYLYAVIGDEVYRRHVVRKPPQP